MTVSSKNYFVGCIFISFVVVIWVLASFWTQFIYSTENFERPFFLTYLSSSLFSIYCIPTFICPTFIERLFKRKRISLSKKEKEEESLLEEPLLSSLPILIEGSKKEVYEDQSVYQLSTRETFIVALIGMIPL